MANPTQQLTGLNPGAAAIEEQNFPMKQTAGGPGVGQTTVTFAGLLTNPAAASQALWTAVTGGTFYITDIVITTTSTATVQVILQDNSTTIFTNHIYSAKGLELIGIETQPSVANGDAFNIAFGGAVTGNVAYFISGFVQ